MTGLRLIASDLDGTFLTPDELVTPLNRRAVLEAREGGVTFVVATGRPLRWLSVLDAIADADPLVICSNGASLFDLKRRRVLTSRGVPHADVRVIVEDLRDAIPGTTFAVERGDIFGCEPGSLSIHAQNPETIIGPIDVLVQRIEPVVKLLVYHADMGSDALVDAALPVVAGRATVTHSLTHSRFGMLELSGPGVTKAAMLADLCADLGVPPEEVVAFGDMPNDLDMLRWAGRGFVMAHAHPALRDEFDVIGSNADSAVGHRILSLLDDRDGRGPRSPVDDQRQA